MKVEKNAALDQPDEGWAHVSSATAPEYNTSSQRDFFCQPD